MREFTFGHARQLESVLRDHLVALCERVDLLPGAAEDPVLIDHNQRPRLPAPAQPLALVQTLSCTVAQHHQPQPTTTRNTLTTRRHGPTGTHRANISLHPLSVDQGLGQYRSVKTTWV